MWKSPRAAIWRMRTPSTMSPWGEQEDIVRATVCFRKIDGDWRVVHEHASVPLMMDMDPDENS